MSFICPQCGSQSLEIVRSLEFPGDASSDEIALQQITCARCGLRGAAVYRESRRGRLDTESWDHSGYSLDDDDYRRLDERMRTCPNPTARDCVCEAHLFLNRRDSHGIWHGLAGFHLPTPFNMISAQKL